MIMLDVEETRPQLMVNYRDVLESARRLSPGEQAQLIRELARSADVEQPAEEHRITELKGLGKGTWAGIDAQEYVRAERASWDDA